MNVDEALAFIHGSPKYSEKKDLAHFKELLSMMGNPQDALKCIHVAGTNGKGSTCSFINRILLSAGFKTGLFTSPFIERFNERMKINDVDIEDGELASISAFVKSKCTELVERGFPHPSEFEVVTAVGFQFFANHSCDFVVLETGLGGRLDATNIISSSEISVVTSIHYDHMNILGDTLEKIAYEKAGIVKDGGHLVLYPQMDSVREVFESVAREKKASLLLVDPAKIVFHTLKENRVVFDFGELAEVEIGLPGKFQLLNAATAISAIGVLVEKGYNITKENIRHGLKETVWPGRFEMISKDPLFFVDGAHNMEGASALMESLEELFPDHRKILLFGLMREKEIDNMIALVGKHATAILTINPLSDRSLDCVLLAQRIRDQYPALEVNAFPVLKDAVEQALALCARWEADGKKSLICSCGSLYSIGEVKKIFRDFRWPASIEMEE